MAADAVQSHEEAPLRVDQPPEVMQHPQQLTCCPGRIIARLTGGAMKVLSVARVAVLCRRSPGPSCPPTSLSYPVSSPPMSPHLEETGVTSA